MNQPLHISNLVGDLPELGAVMDFVKVPTPQAWVAKAIGQTHVLLQDHANCEKKAASTAMNLMFKYNDNRQLQAKLAQLVREEMLHYEQVLAHMQARNLPWINVSASRYAQQLRTQVRTYEPAAFVDIMIIGALVEARSCERFAALIPYADPELAKFYKYLLKSEARHFSDYLALAISHPMGGNQVEPAAFTARVALLTSFENKLITSPDPQFHFHSGVPV